MTARYVEVPREGMFLMLEAAGFEQVAPSSASDATWRGEVVFERAHACVPHLKVRVFTSFSRNATSARGLGEDAIRVALVYDPPAHRSQGIDAAKRVFRTGTVEGVLKRTLQRMRETYSFANQMAKRGPCRVCSAPCYADSGRCIIRECREGARAAS